MKELKELQEFLTALIADTILKDRKTEVEAKIVLGEPEYTISIYEEGSEHFPEITARDSTVKRCKKRLEFEVEMLLSK